MLSVLTEECFRDPKSAPLVCGIWTADDTNDGQEVFTAEIDEVKFVTQGLLDIGLLRTQRQASIN